MSSPATSMYLYLHTAVQDALQMYDLRTATFLCERLVALDTSIYTGEAQVLLATCYYRNKEPKRAHAILKDCTSPEARYMFALCCYEIELYLDGETALLGTETLPVSMNGNQIEELDLDRISVPNQAHGFALLGRICQRTSRRTQAVKFFRHAIRLNPYLWSAFEALALLGEDIDVSNVFTPHSPYVVAASSCSVPVGYSLPSLISSASAAMSRSSTVPSSSSHPQQTTSRASLVPFETPFISSSTAMSAAGLLGQTPAVHARPTPFASATPMNPAALFSAHAINKASPGEPTPIAGEGAGATFETPPSSNDSRDPFESQQATTKNGPDLVSRQIAPGVRKKSKREHENALLGSTKIGSGINSRLPVMSPVPFPTSAAHAQQRTSDEMGTVERSTRRSARLSFSSSTTDGLEFQSTLNFSSSSSSSSSSSMTPATTAGQLDTTIRRTARDKLTVGNQLTAKHGKAQRTKKMVQLPENEEAESPVPAFKGFSATPAHVWADDWRPSSSAGGGLESAFRPLQSSTQQQQQSQQASFHTADQDMLLFSQTNAAAVVLGNELRLLARGHLLASNYQCAEALQVLQQLSRSQFMTGWVLATTAKCHFEMVEYSKSVQFYQLMRKVDPHRMEGLGLFSTALWHLKKDTDLSFLAQAAIASNRFSPEAWLVLGNCFSLQKEHELALKFFHRAIQVDPWCAYAYTLSSHEYVANEDFDKATAGYRQAIGVDPRHYNAWYGLGNIYYRQEKYELATYHFRRAVAINSSSSVLYCYLGMVLHASKNYDKALEVLEKAATLSSTNPLAKFQMANVYISQEQYELALQELEQVRSYAPREASVHFLMGKIHKKLHQYDLAMTRFLTALDLDPKDRNLVKSAIDKLYTAVDDSDSDESI